MSIDPLIELLALSKDTVMIGNECVIRIDDAVRLVREFQKTEQPDKINHFLCIHPYWKNIYKDPNEQPDDCRKAFEQWAGHEEDCNLAHVIGHEHYLDSWTQAAWTGWQASWKLEREFGELTVKDKEDALALMELGLIGHGSIHYGADELAERAFNSFITHFKIKRIEGGKS